MEVETLTEWMLRRREEMTRTVADDRIMRHTMDHFVRRMQNLRRIWIGPYTYGVVHRWSEKGALESKRTYIRKWIVATVLTLFVGAAPAEAAAQKAVYLMNVCKEWSAWYNAQPLGTKTLHITGICTFHAEGYHVELSRRKQRSCILDLAIAAPTGIGGIERGIRHVQVHYSEQIEPPRDSINIEPDDVTVPVKIIR